VLGEETSRASILRLSDSKPWPCLNHVKDLSNAIQQISSVISRLWAPVLEIPSDIPRTIYHGRMGGLGRFSMLLLGTTPADKLELSYRVGLRSSLGFSLSHLRSANLPPLFHQRIAAAETSLGRLLALPKEQPLFSTFLTWCREDNIDE